MDLSAIFQLRTKRVWWMDVIFYFVISLLVATVLCYLIFLTKNSFQREDIKKEIAALQTVGTDQQKGYEKEVISYQGKINDFSNLLKNHEFASNVFAFVQAQTMPNIWFNQFTLDEKNNGVQLSGEADSMDALSRQVATFEKNKYIESIGNLSSSLGTSSRIKLNINLVLNQDIFSYLSSALSVSENVAPAGQSLSVTGTQGGQTTQAVPGATPTPTPNNLPANQATTVQQPSPSPAVAKSSEKLITSFHLLLNPEVVGAVDETKYSVTLNVPYGTDVKNLVPAIVISPGATILPASDLPQDFTNPVTYMVTAQDGSIQNYEVSVIVAAPQAVSKKSSQSGSIALTVIIFVVIIAVIAVISLFVWKKIKGPKIKS